jgi:hypothetical protein
MAHKESKPVRMAKIEMIEGQLNNFIMFDDETTQKIFNRLKKMVNKAKTLGYKRWTDRMLTERLMRSYTTMNYNMVALIRQDSTYKKMISDDVFGRIINHEIYNEEVSHMKNFYKGVTTTKKQEIALKSSKKSKNKQVVVESSSEKEEGSSECDVEKMALFMRKFKKYMNNKFLKGDKKFNTKSTTKRTYYNCRKYGHFIANYSFERMDNNNNNNKSKFYKKDKGYKKSDKPYKKKSYGEAHIG